MAKITRNCPLHSFLEPMSALEILFQSGVATDGVNSGAMQRGYKCLCHYLLEIFWVFPNVLFALNFLVSGVTITTPTVSRCMKISCIHYRQSPWNSSWPTAPLSECHHFSLGLRVERLLARFPLAILSRAAESTGFLLDLTLPSECKKQKPCLHSGFETIVRFYDWLKSNKSVVREAGKGLLTLCYRTDNFMS